MDLNQLRIPTSEEWHDGRLKDYSVEGHKVSVHFKDLDLRIAEYIRRSDAVLGCVAWLTHEKIIDALATVDCSIILQKEDLWRPDMPGPIGVKSKQRIRSLYERLKCDVTRHSLPGIGADLSKETDPSIDPLRCVGTYNSTRRASAPRAHHKFLVFCHKEPPREKGGHELLSPYAVWTGSFNLTQNATTSFENAVYIRDREIALAFAQEYAQILALSEPLEWTSHWAAPEYRIGT